MQWTIDTTILGQSASGNMDATEILNIIKRKKYLVVDANGRILEEYYKCLNELEREGGNYTKAV